MSSTADREADSGEQEDKESGTHPLTCRPQVVQHDLALAVHDLVHPRTINAYT